MTEADGRWSGCSDDYRALRAAFENCETPARCRLLVCGIGKPGEIAHAIVFLASDEAPGGDLALNGRGHRPEIGLGQAELAIKRCRYRAGADGVHADSSITMDAGFAKIGNSA
ncbi:MAG: hypothetical protein ABSF64_17120 [Bryobacteraceae bacterium]